MKNVLRKLKNRKNLVVSLVLMMLVIIGSSQSTKAAIYPITDETNFKLALANAVDGDTLSITKDIQLTDELVIPSGKRLTFTGDYKIIGASNRNTLHVMDSVDITLDGPNITHNSGSFGTGILLEGDTELDLFGGAISNNRTSGNNQGGAITMQSLEATNITIDGTDIYGNVAQASNAAGGINISGSSDSTIKLVSGNINSNSAQAAGGIYSTGIVEISGGTIHDNTAYWGGAIRARGVDISGGKIYNNTASNGQGGAIYNGETNNSYVRISGGEIYDNDTSGYGGAVSTLNTSINMTGGLIHDNTAQSAGGGISGQQIKISGGEIYSNNSTHANASVGGGITGNDIEISGIAKIYDNTAARGAGIYVSTNKFKMSGGEIYNNTASNNGGGVYIYGTGANTVEISGGLIHDNSAASSGGGVMADRSLIAISNDVKFYKNDAIAGGGLHTSGDSTTTITGGEFYNNTATLDGGGISAYGDTIISGTTSIHDNESGSSGGGLRVNGMANLTDGEFYNNKTSGDGGAIYYNTVESTESLTITNTKINNNEAVNGGGVYNYSGLTTISSGVISNNTAEIGGGIFTRDNFKIFEGTLQNNIATSTVKGASGSNVGTGGAIYTSVYGDLYVGEKTIFKDNVAMFGYESLKTADGSIYDSNIAATSWTAPFTQGYNNYDINYLGSDAVVKVVFHLNDGTDSIVKEVLVPEGEAIADIMPSDPARTDYYFKGWNFSADGFGTNFTEIAIPSAGVTHVYAQWEQIKYWNLGFDANIPGGANGSGVTLPETLRVAIPELELTRKTDIKANALVLNITNPTGVPTIQGGVYEFIGWNTQADGLGTTYSDVTTIPVQEEGANLTLYAQWKFTKASNTTNTGNNGADTTVSTTNTGAGSDGSNGEILPKTGQDLTIILVAFGLGIMGIFGLTVRKKLN